MAFSRIGATCAVGASGKLSVSRKKQGGGPSRKADHIRVSLAAAPVVAGAVVAVGLGATLLRRSVKFLGQDKQLVIQRLTEKVVKNGPGVVVLKPVETATLRTATALGETEYVKVMDTVTLSVRIERGPMLLFLGPYEDITFKGTGTTLTSTEYLHVFDQITGGAKVVKGPQMWFPGPHEVSYTIKTAVSLQEDEFVKIKDKESGKRWVQKGKFLLFLEPNWEMEGGGVCKAWTLKSYEYIRLLDTATGRVTVHRGEQTVFPEPNEELLDEDTLSADDLEADEYMKIADKSTGTARVVAGPGQVFLGAHEAIMDGGKKKAVQVDEERAALVRHTSTGQLKLVTERQLFVPGPDETVEEVREVIKLADYEAVIVKDKDGALNFYYGSADKAAGGTRSFFLPPHAELVQLWWSSGLRRENRDLCIEKFDCRPNYMWFEFDCRTKDNVELVLETTFFYEVKDLAQMVSTTGNLPGDIYNQARSQFIEQVAGVTLKQFMEQLHDISQTIFKLEPEFYAKRGIKVHAINVTKYSCAEPRTSEVLQQIIEETTDRLNRLSKAESENEVGLFRMQGQIEQEKLNSELLAIQQEHAKSEAIVAGAAEAERVGAFMKGLEKEVPELEDRIALWQVLRKGDALSTVSEGNASLYYTPNDVDLSIQTKRESN